MEMELLFILALIKGCYCSSETLDMKQLNPVAPITAYLIKRLTDLEDQSAEQRRQTEVLRERLQLLESDNMLQAREIRELRHALKAERNMKTQATEARGGWTNEVGPATNRTANRRYATHQRKDKRSADINVAFLATLTHIMADIGHGQYVPFDHVITNVGHAYNPIVGVFIAPVHGIYVFSATVNTLGNGVAHFGITVNGKVITVMFINGAENAWDSSSVNVAIELNQGDDVAVTNTDAAAALNGEHHCVFSGFLLRQTQEVFSIVG